MRTFHPPPPPPLASITFQGCGPAGLSLSAELASRGVRVGLIGPDHGFVNTYGVWADELEKLDLGDTFERVYPSSVCYYGDQKSTMNAPTRVSRRYARVDKAKLRAKLLRRCEDSGNVQYSPGMVATSRPSDDAVGAQRILECAGGDKFGARLVAIASGSAGASTLLEYECDIDDRRRSSMSAESSPVPLAGAVQTAYGFEAEVSSYPFDSESMVFMDYRRHHSGLWPQTAGEMEHTMNWGSNAEVPSFLYAMPIEGTSRVFLEETCLVARPVLPFEILKQRLHRRCEALGIHVKEVFDEEWSYIPVGGAMPTLSQEHFGFGAAAGMVHPATGYSIARTLTEAPDVAEHIASCLGNSALSSRSIAESSWAHLWSRERRRQAAFNLFGMELLMGMPLSDINIFFSTFFRLPHSLWSKFLSNELSSAELLVFALAMFVYAPNSLRLQLCSHLVSHPSGKAVVLGYIDLLRAKLGVIEEEAPTESAAEKGSAAISA